MCSWQYTNFIDIWVTFVSENISEHDLQPLLFIIVQIINGVACLFIGPRYLPLRIKCIQWLNNLSRSSGIFIPVASFALDILEYKVGKAGGKHAKDFSFSYSVKVSNISSILGYELVISLEKQSWGSLAYQCSMRNLHGNNYIKISGKCSWGK